MSVLAEKAPSIDQGPRRALGWGAALLVLGLAMVGVGAGDEGAVVVLAGLGVMILGIHTFGRLGSDDPTEPGPAVDRALANQTMWFGGIVLLMGVVVTAGSYMAATTQGSTGQYVLAYGAILGGAFRVFRGYADMQISRRRLSKVDVNVKRGRAKVEKRRRMDKSPAP